MSRGNKNAVWLMQGWLFYSDAAFWKEPQMKGIEQNPVVYELTSEMAFRNKKVEVEQGKGIN
nr:unnamed protein product [Digitaria exilis]